MTTNSYFRSNFSAATKDQSLLESLIIESIQIYGIDMKYIPRTYVNFDELFGEDQSSTFDRFYTIEMYNESIESFGGDGHFLSKFGIEVRDEIKVLVSIKRFEEEIGVNEADISRPREGDLIQLPSEIDRRNRIFEISFVDDYHVNHQIGKLNTYLISAKLFEYGGETFETGDTAIDSFESYAQTTTLTLAAGVDVYAVGESVTQASGFSGEVVAWDDPLIVLTAVKGDLLTTETLDGAAASRLPLETESETSNDGISDNDFIETKESTLIDFSESNPFSE